MNFDAILVIRFSDEVTPFSPEERLQKVALALASPVPRLFGPVLESERLKIYLIDCCKWLFGML
jgi:hypothetical protein